LLGPEELAAAGLAGAYALTDIEPDPARCMSEAGPLLERLAERLAGDWVTGPKRADWPAGPKVAGAVTAATRIEE
jgi:glycerate kinase